MKMTEKTEPQRIQRNASKLEREGLGAELNAIYVYSLLCFIVYMARLMFSV